MCQTIAKEDFRFFHNYTVKPSPLVQTLNLEKMQGLSFSRDKANCL